MHGCACCVFFFLFFFRSISQGSRQSPLLAKMGGDLGSPSFPPVKAVARATPCQCREARRFLPSFGVSLFLCPKNFSALLTRDIGNIGNCMYVLFFCGAKKIIQNGAAGEKKLRYGVKS